MVLPDDQLKQLLLQSGTLDENSWSEALSQATTDEKPISVYLSEQNIISDEDLGLIIAKHLNLPFVLLSKRSIPIETLNVIPRHVAEMHKSIVFSRGDDGVSLASNGANVDQLVSMVKKKTGEKVLVHYATDQDIENALLLYQNNLQNMFEELLGGDVEKAAHSDYDDAPLEKIVDLLIYTAYTEKSSDIHIEPEETHSLIRFRIDGILHDVLRVPRKLHERIVTRIKVLSNLRTDEHLSAQDGKMRMSLEEEKLDLRISIIPIVQGEKLVMRLLTSHARSYSLSDLGMNEKDLLKITKALKRSFGMILSTGPTGSGKTTTIYSLLKILNTREKNITSIEDPVEYRIKGANQVQVNPKTNLTFAAGLRSLLRQDPDYIFVGEIRDNETAGIAVNAALTGHLVLSTLHTNDAPTALPRLIDMQVEPFLTASTVTVIIAQRLTRKICDNCRVSFTITEDELLKHFPADMVKKHYIPVGVDREIRIYKGKGCKVCHYSGYSGRIGLFEVLEMTNSVRTLVAQKKDSDTIRLAAINEGMITMLDDGLDKVTKGMTTIEEVLRVTTVESS